jgi:hypothetical protein
VSRVRRAHHLVEQPVGLASGRTEFAKAGHRNLSGGDAAAPQGGVLPTSGGTPCRFGSGLANARVDNLISLSALELPGRSDRQPRAWPSVSRPACPCWTPGGGGAQGPGRTGQEGLQCDAPRMAPRSAPQLGRGSALAMGPRRRRIIDPQPVRAAWADLQVGGIRTPRPSGPCCRFRTGVGGGGP